VLVTLYSVVTSAIALPLWCDYVAVQKLWNCLLTHYYTARVTHAPLTNRAIVVNNKLVQGAAKKKGSKDQNNNSAAASVPGSAARSGSNPASPQASNSVSPANSPVLNRQQLALQLARDPSQQSQQLSVMKPPSPTSASAVKHSHRLSVKHPAAPPYVSL
jgi:hypothetical protein